MWFYSGIRSFIVVTVTLTVVNLEQNIKEKTITFIIVWNTAGFTPPTENFFHILVLVFPICDYDHSIESSKVHVYRHLFCSSQYEMLCSPWLVNPMLTVLITSLIDEQHYVVYTDSIATSKSWLLSIMPINQLFFHGQTSNISRLIALFCVRMWSAAKWKLE